MTCECKCKKKEKNWRISYDTGSLNYTSEFDLCDDCEKGNPIFSQFRISVKRIDEKSPGIN